MAQSSPPAASPRHVLGRGRRCGGSAGAVSAPGRRGPPRVHGVSAHRPSAASDAFAGSAADTPGSRLPGPHGEPRATFPRGFAGTGDAARGRSQPPAALVRRRTEARTQQWFLLARVSAGPSAGGEPLGTEDTEVWKEASVPVNGRGAATPAGRQRSPRVTACAGSWGCGERRRLRDVWGGAAFPHGTEGSGGQNLGAEALRREAAPASGRRAAGARAVGRARGGSRGPGVRRVRRRGGRPGARAWGRAAVQPEWPLGGVSGL